MGIFLNPGNSGFQSAVRSDIYIDKTKLIQFTNGVLDTEQRFLCVSRPRRFGKSVTAKMLAAYYSCGCNSQSLFEKMDIGNDPSYRQELNRNNVIYMDIQWFRSVARGKGQLKNVVGYMQEQVIEELKQRYPDVLSSDGISSSLPEVLLRIYNALGDRFIIIIDEWDCLFREEKEDSGLQEAYIDFLRGMFKGQPAEEFVRLAYMTGILPVKKYGTQSALNNFDGYDGYTFKRVRSVYSPSSVTRAMRNREFGNYWTETETYESLKFYMDMDLDGLKSALFQMLGGARCRIDTGTFQNDMTSIKSRDDVLTLLIHLGYLAYDSEKKAVFIPNEEIRQEFVRAVKTGRRGELARLVTASDQLLKDTLDMKLHSCVIERYAREA